MALDGTVLDRKYRVIRLIGKGGMGTVYEAEHIGVHRQVALKFLSLERAHDADAVARFKREAEAAGRIGHDNICEVTDFGVGPDGSPYFVMPRLHGCPLSAAIAQDGPFPPERACDIATQTLAALSAAHAAGIVHRDLKPDNIFLTTLGGRPDFVKVLDFGISKVMKRPGPENENPSLTKTGSVLGTPAYMAPEQARGAKDIDQRVDIYAVGVILYEMLTARRPFDAESFNEILWKVWNDSVAPPRNHRPDLPVELERTVLRAMNREREQRFPTADAFRQALVPEAWGSDSADSLPVSSGPAHDTDSVLPRHSTGTAPTTPVGSSPDVTTSSRAARASVFTESRVAPRGMRRVAAIVGALVVVLGIVMVIAIRRGASGSSAPEGGPLTSSAGAEAEPAAAEVAPVAAATAAGPSSLAESIAEDARETLDAADGAAPSGPATKPDDAGDRLGVDSGATKETVRITLRDLPPGAQVAVDGTPVEAPAFDLPKADQTVLVTVRADGFEAWEQQVTASATATIPVTMRRSSAGTRRPPRVDAGVAAAPEQDAGAPRDARSTPEAIISTFGQMP